MRKLCEIFLKNHFVDLITWIFSKSCQTSARTSFSITKIFNRPFRTRTLWVCNYFLIFQVWVYYLLCGDNKKEFACFYWSWMEVIYYCQILVELYPLGNGRVDSNKEPQTTLPKISIEQRLESSRNSYLPYYSHWFLSSACQMGTQKHVISCGWLGYLTLPF